MELDVINDYLLKISALLNNYESGNLLLIADIQDKFQKLKTIFEKFKSLKKLNILIDYMYKILKISTYNRSKEDKAISLIIDLVKLLQSFFSKSISSKVFSENINSNLQSIKELLSQNKPKEEKERDYFYQECYWGPFSREVILPLEVDNSKAQAYFREGILTIRIPKIEREKRKKIVITE